jgi:hypothetical protein
MSGDESEILREWQRLVGDPAWEPEDLDDSWPVQFGSYIEEFALNWHERKSRCELTRRGEVISHPDRPWFCATLDGFRADDGGTVIDVKAIGGWRKIPDVIGFYTPQLIGQAACTGAERAALLIVHGGSEPTEHAVEWDANYENMLWERVAAFWHCVETLNPPIPQTPAPAPIAPVKTYDMSTDNLWCVESGIWLENRVAARKFQAAEKELKGLVPLDAIRAFGAGVEIRRNKAGSLALREQWA